MGCAASKPTVTSLNPSPSKSVKSSSSPTAAHILSNSTITKRDRHTNAQDMVQNFLLIWLDGKIDEFIDDYRNSIKQLRRTVNTIEIFRDVDECIGYISQLQNEKSFLIVSGALCESVVPRIHDVAQVYSIYIFCRKQSKYEEWALSWFKVKGIFTEINSICDSVRQCARQCDEDSVVISGLSSLNQIEPSFMYTQLFKEIILEIDFDGRKEINDLVEYASEKYSGNVEDLEIINEFARNYRGNVNDDNKPIWWYSRECFTYHMLNKALGILHIETLLKMGIFIRDLHQNIEKLHTAQSNKMSSQTATIIVYRGKTMIKKDFESKIKQDGLISFNNFLSTSDDRNIAIRFIREGLKFSNNNNKIGVLFTMTIDRSISSAPFARIDQISYFQTENEILFSMNTVFRVQQIKEIKDGELMLWQVKLTLTTDSDDQQLNTLTKRMREEITGTGWQRMGSLLWKLREDDKAEQVYRMLLHQASNESDRAYGCNQLGLIKYEQGDYNLAVEFHEKALGIWQKTLPPNHPDLANSYNNLGLVNDNMGQYSKALSFYERTLEIRQNILPENHPDLAQSYNNIGLVYGNMGEYSKAILSYGKALDIWQKSLPPNHPLLAVCCNNIGLAYDNVGQYSDALSFYERAIQIRLKVLPQNHPDCAQSYNNIGLVYGNMGEYSTALSFYEKALDIWQQTLPPNHPLVAVCCNNIGLAYGSMNEYSKALSFHERALQIRQNTLGKNHPDCAQSYNNIGLVYDNMGEYSKALSFYDKAFDIWQKALPPTHRYIALSKRNIELVKEKM
ncbi:unnamed protein product [Rotaria sp. Silwood2]|nr:unnamed protein product [Rotaria sp. Silwood2]CAF2934473.1 unnamed protein product [Rotaria sp. Silwood2]CAF3140760.1 unnamed protein product [Rotaria sp. Silwood2]CAF3327115.1 unnamed protein product [Rotaria sp. Silwood2]CAF4224203.1 unnamed protein product [Rotaria sp. Silwood2]